MSPNGSGSSRASSAASSISDIQMEHDDSSATEDYDMPQVIGDVIDLSSTQFMTQAPVGLGAGEDDDDVILIPQHVETIDLCSESVYEIPRRPLPLLARDEVIEIQDSPASARREGPRVMIPHRGPRVMIADRPAEVVVRTSPVIRPAPRHPARTSPYQAAAATRKTPPKPRQLNLDDSINDNDEPTQRVKITCPICLDSSMKKKMVSTKCGHIHCEECLKSSLQAAKKCPVCRKALTGKDPFHPIYFGGHQ